MAEYEAGVGAPRIEDAPAVQLPSFDDFRRRDAAAAATAAAEPASFDPLRSPQPAAPARGEPQNAAERLMELLAFDTIDERPRNEDPYDATARIIGRGLPNKAGAYTLPYLQTGHMLLLGVLLLSSSISYPGFPLTEESRRHPLLCTPASTQLGTRPRPRAALPVFLALPAPVETHSLHPP